MHGLIFDFDNHYYEAEDADDSCDLIVDQAEPDPSEAVLDAVRRSASGEGWVEVERV